MAFPVFSYVVLFLHTFQVFSDNITGVADANATIPITRQPRRCGTSYFFNPNIKGVPIHTVSHYSLFRNNPKWNRRRLKYSFNSSVKEEAKPQLVRALKTWASATPFKFSYVEKMSKADIKISFVSGDHGDGYPFGNGAGTAHTFPPPDGRVHFDVNENWSSIGKSKNALAMDIQTVGLHEFGHALGLGHSKIEKAVMYKYIGVGERKRKLHKDDISGIKALYGN